MTDEPIDVKANNAWLAAHQNEYVGEWVALHNGKLIDHATRYTELNIGELPPRDVLFTHTQFEYGSVAEAMLAPEIDRLRDEVAQLREAVALNAAQDAMLRAELESETRWAKRYHDEAEQLRADNARLTAWVSKLEDKLSEYDSSWFIPAEPNETGAQE